MDVIFHYLLELLGEYFSFYCILDKVQNIKTLFFLFLRGQDFDKRQWESANIYEQYNVPDSYRDKSELARSIQAEKRAGNYYQIF